MSTGVELWPIVVLMILFLGSFNVNSLSCYDSRCKTRTCNSDGACICNLPDPSTILDGDRPFLGGKFCDEEMTMCDGSNSFWCEHGGTCEEIVQGENYTCKCLPGFTGEHCEHSGAPCGRIFCFHEAECLVEAEGDVCQCTPDWKGSLDCSLPTKTQTDTSTDSEASRVAGEKSRNSTNWAVGLLAVACSAGAVAGGAIYAKKLRSKKETETARFQQLSQMQSIMDDDEHESIGPDGTHHDSSHI
ncbi:Cadherin-related tumor suppressor [Morella rubra]|uniref:Cadherin-related tumor suppressor n=1 Tax=Morella rubra TaxID=262757 RepID=A0A6A1W3J4_9ROSI|nr:Cadherin-related tumor suppressor [Morella rubra]